MSEEIKQELVDEMADAPLRSDTAVQQDPPFGNETGPSPGDTALQPNYAADDGEKSLTETGEEPVPGTFDNGGVDAPNADGAQRPDAN